MRARLAIVLLALACGSGLAAPSGALGQPAALQACRSDAQALCPSARPGDGQLLPCLQSHADALAPACRAALPALAACHDAAQRLCGDAGAGQRRACLAQHRGELARCVSAAH